MQGLGPGLLPVSSPLSPALLLSLLFPYSPVAPLPEVGSLLGWSRQLFLCCPYSLFLLLPFTLSGSEFVSYIIFFSSSEISLPFLMGKYPGNKFLQFLSEKVFISPSLCRIYIIVHKILVWWMFFSQHFKYFIPFSSFFLFIYI